MYLFFSIVGFGYLLQVSVIDEGRDMWKVYLDLKVFAAALANCRDPLQRDQVYLVQVIVYLCHLSLVNRKYFSCHSCHICNSFLSSIFLSPAYSPFARRISLILIMCELAPSLVGRGCICRQGISTSSIILCQSNFQLLCFTLLLRDIVHFDVDTCFLCRSIM